jgi:hypothetical protein
MWAVKHETDDVLRALRFAIARDFPILGFGPEDLDQLRQEATTLTTQYEEEFAKALFGAPTNRDLPQKNCCKIAALRANLRSRGVGE